MSTLYLVAWGIIALTTRPAPEGWGGALFGVVTVVFFGVVSGCVIDFRDRDRDDELARLIEQMSRK